MSGITAVASRWTLSAGTLLAVGGGLALYQMTSLVLGPAAIRQLHVSLNIPALDVDESSLPFTSSVNLVLGIVAAPAWAAVPGRPAAPHQAPSAPATQHAVAPVAPVPTPVAKTPPVVPVTPAGSPQPPGSHPSDPSVPPIAGPSDEQVSAQNLNDND